MKNTMSYSCRVASPGSWPGPCRATGKKLSQACWGVTPAAASTPIVIAVTATMIKPATRGPDPVLGREGIDIGFLSELDCRAVGSARFGLHGAVRGRAPPVRGRRTARIIPEGPAIGMPNGEL